MSSPERLNVLLSRARDGLIMIGNIQTFTEARKGAELWIKLVEHLKEHGNIYDGLPVVCVRHPDHRSLLKTPADFDAECPDGGCNRPWYILLSFHFFRIPTQSSPQWRFAKLQNALLSVEMPPTV
jgi:hypothetical protein